MRHVRLLKHLLLWFALALPFAAQAGHTLEPHTADPVFLDIPATTAAARVDPASRPVRELAPIPASWVRRNAGPIEFWFDPRYERAVDELIGIAPAQWKRIERELGMTVAGGTRILVAHDPEEYRAVQPGRGVAEWTAGVTYPTLNLIVLRLTGLGEDSGRQLRETFVHELSHAIVHRALPGRRVPRWLLEGVAMHHSREFDLARIEVLLYGALTSGLIPFHNLSRGFPQGSGAARLAYAQSLEFVHFLIDDEGTGGLTAVLQRFRDDGDLDGAFRTVYGRGLVQLENEFRDTLRFEYVVVPVVTGSGFVWGLITVLFMISYVRRRRETRRRMDTMEHEETRERERSEYEQRRALDQLLLDHDAPAGDYVENRRGGWGHWHLPDRDGSSDAGHCVFDASNDAGGPPPVPESAVPAPPAVARVTSLHEYRALRRPHPASGAKPAPVENPPPGKPDPDDDKVH